MHLLWLYYTAIVKERTSALIYCVAIEQYNNGHDLEKSWACIGVMSKRNEGSKDSPELWMRSW